MYLWLGLSIALKKLRNELFTASRNIHSTETHVAERHTVYGVYLSRDE